MLDALRRSRRSIAAERLGIAFPRGAWERAIRLRHRALRRLRRRAGSRRPLGSCRPAIASASIFTISSIDRMLSSLPGIGRSTRSGSQSVSISATVATPSFWASLTAFFSFFGSTMTRHSGSRFIVRMPLQVAEHLAIFAVERRLHLLRVRVDLVAVRGSLRALRAASSRLRIVRKLVSVPPSQRSLTNGMPQRCGFAADRVGRLPLRADEQHQAALRRRSARDTSSPAAGRGPSRGRR